MSADYIKRCSIYCNLFKNVGEQNKVLEGQHYTAFGALAGKKYSGELMVIGRAVNGWLKNWAPCEMNSEQERKKRVRELFGNNENSEQCPMSWVTEKWGNNNEYNTKKSAFWQVIQCVIRDLGISHDDLWSSHLLWSNLYKISPSKGGNPSSKLIKLQRDYCLDILECEVKEFKPRRILFLTGLDWADSFLKKLNVTSITKLSSNFVDFTGFSHFNDNTITKVVVAQHPQGKSREKIVTEIYGGFELLDKY